MKHIHDRKILHRDIKTQVWFYNANFIEFLRNAKIVLSSYFYLYCKIVLIICVDNYSNCDARVTGVKPSDLHESESMHGMHVKDAWLFLK